MKCDPSNYFTYKGRHAINCTLIEHYDELKTKSCVKKEKRETSTVTIIGKKIREPNCFSEFGKESLIGGFISTCDGHEYWTLGKNKDLLAEWKNLRYLNSKAEITNLIEKGNLQRCGHISATATTPSMS